MQGIEQYEYPDLKPFDQDWRWCHKYAYDVVTGAIPAGKAIKRACERHFRDLERDDLHFDEDAAQSIVTWFKFIPITDGKDAGKPTILLPWQIWVVVSLIAWKWNENTYDEDGNPLSVMGERRFNQAFILVSRKAGKALSLDTPIPTPDGWTTMGELKEGDVVFDEKGDQCNVTDVTDVQYGRTCYKLTFSNGETVIADADHQWLTTARVDRPNFSKVRQGRYEKNRPATSVRTTQEIYDSLTYGKRGDFNHTIDMPEPLQCDEKDLPIDPYVLGYWLGDGDTNSLRISCGKDDLDSLIFQIGKAGYGYSHFVDSKNLDRISIRSLNDNGSYVCKSDKNSNLTHIMRSMGLIGEKFIPENYLRASFNQRLALFQGLMDSDGTIDRTGKCIEFSQTKRELTDCVCELAASLGLKYTLNIKHNRKFNSDSYLVRFMAFRDEIPVFRLPRKLERMRLKSNCKVSPRSRSVTIVGCEPVDSVPVKCIAVDSPSRLYRFGRTMLPTHNTTLAAGVMLYLMYKAGYQPRAFSLATKRDQAKLLWKTAKVMIKLSPRLRAVFENRANEILMPNKDGEFRALASDSNSLDGLNPITASLDECHAVKDRNLYQVIISAFGAQTEYLMLVITTAGFVLDGICVDLYNNGLRVLDPTDEVEQDNYFYAMWQIDKGDDWTDHKSWYKANAGLVYGLPKMKYLRDRFKEAQMSVEEKANFLTKHCNVFVSGTDTWLDIDKVKECASQLSWDDFKDRTCYVGLDRALVSDITSASVLFPTDDGGAAVFLRNMQSSGAIASANDYLKGIYMRADAIGDLDTVQANSIRNEDVKKLIRELWNELPNCEGFYYDPYHMTQLANELEEEGIPMIGVSQGTGNMSEPAKNLESLIDDGLFKYNNSVLFEYACTCALTSVTRQGNMQVFRDPNNAKVDKIDPLIATIIALSGATLIKQDSLVYNERGMIFI